MLHIYFFKSFTAVEFRVIIFPYNCFRLIKKQKNRVRIPVWCSDAVFYKGLVKTLNCLCERFAERLARRNSFIIGSVITNNRLRSQNSADALALVLPVAHPFAVAPAV